MKENGGIVTFTVRKMKWWVNSELLTLEATQHAKKKESSKMCSSQSDICIYLPCKGT